MSSHQNGSAQSQQFASNTKKHIIVLLVAFAILTWLFLVFVQNKNDDTTANIEPQPLTTFDLGDDAPVIPKTTLLAKEKVNQLEDEFTRSQEQQKLLSQQLLTKQKIYDLKQKQIDILEEEIAAVQQ